MTAYYTSTSTSASCMYKSRWRWEAVQVAGLERFVVPGVVGTDAIFMHQRREPTAQRREPEPRC